MTFCVANLPAGSMSLADTVGSAFIPLWQTLDCATQVRFKSTKPASSFLMKHNIPYFILKS